MWMQEGGGQNLSMSRILQASEREKPSLPDRKMGEGDLKYMVDMEIFGCKREGGGGQNLSISRILQASEREKPYLPI